MTAPGRAAADMAGLLETIFGTTVPVRLRLWDGSESGPPEGPTVMLRSPDALRYLIWSPGELGLARAYVTGNLDVEGDLETALRHVRAALDGHRPRLTGVGVARSLKLLAGLGVLGRPLPAPRSEARPRGRLHSMRRDAQVISHHYDLSNDFYSLLLDRSMAYSCGYWTQDDPGYGVADAQRDKLDLICRKLDLRPGAQLLDVGCGWGSLAVHAAREYGAAVTAVTVAKEQQEFVADRVRAEGVEHLVTLRRGDYREVLAAPGRAFDAAAAIEMGEHVGQDNYPAFLSGLRRCLRDEGRLLIQVMSRGTRHPGGGPFIERYIAPDMHMRPIGATVDLLQQSGFEVRDVHAMREHYARTIRAWAAEMTRRWDEAVALIGEERARVWQLYLAGGALSFAENRMGVDQVLSMRTGRGGRSGMPASRREWEQPAPGPAVSITAS